MFRVDQFIAVCSALIAFGTTASAATPETRRSEDVPSVMVSAYHLPIARSGSQSHLLV